MICKIQSNQISKGATIRRLTDGEACSGEKAKDMPSVSLVLQTDQTTRIFIDTEGFYLC